MSRLTKKYADTKRYYSTHTCDEILQKLGKLEDKETPKKPRLIKLLGNVVRYKCSKCNGGDILKPLYKFNDYCPYCGQKLEWSDE